MRPQIPGLSPGGLGPHHTFLRFPLTFPQPYDGQSQGKIDQAYGLAWAQSLNQTVNSSMSKDRRYLLANEEGSGHDRHGPRLTGEPIDHFAEANLAGFYALARAFGGIERA